MTNSAKPLSPFDFASAAGHTKLDLFSTLSDEDLGSYSVFMVNKVFSQYDDCVLWANEMNMYAGLVTPRAHFEYYRGAIRPRKRYSPWNKVIKSADIETVCKYYQCSPYEAEGYVELLSEDQIADMKKSLSLGGINPSKK